MKAHNRTNCGNHLQMTVFVGTICATDFREQIGATPTNEGDN
jgi:hypothetical protein